MAPKKKNVSTNANSITVRAEGARRMSVYRERAKAGRAGRSSTSHSERVRRYRINPTLPNARLMNMNVACQPRRSVNTPPTKGPSACPSTFPAMLRHDGVALLQRDRIADVRHAQHHR